MPTSPVVCASRSGVLSIGGSGSVRAPSARGGENWSIVKCTVIVASTCLHFLVNLLGGKGGAS